MVVHMERGLAGLFGRDCVVGVVGVHVELDRAGGELEQAATQYGGVVVDDRDDVVFGGLTGVGSVGDDDIEHGVGLELLVGLQFVGGQRDRMGDSVDPGEFQVMVLAVQGDVGDRGEDLVFGSGLRRPFSDANARDGLSWVEPALTELRHGGA